MSSDDSKRLATIEQWEEFAYGLQTSSDCLVYLLAHNHFINEMEEILATAKNPVEVQEKFTNLLQDRKTFVAHGNANLPDFF